MDDDITQVCCHVWSVWSHVHQTLKGCGGSIQAERENLVLPVATGRTEGSLSLGIWGQRHLPVSLLQVKIRYKPCSPQTLHQVIDSVQGVAVESETAFSLQKSLHSWMLPLGFGTTTMGLADSLMILSWSIRLISSSIA